MSSVTFQGVWSVDIQVKCTPTSVQPSRCRSPRSELSPWISWTVQCLWLSSKATTSTYQSQDSRSQFQHHPQCRGSIPALRPENTHEIWGGLGVSLGETGKNKAVVQREKSMQCWKGVCLMESPFLPSFSGTPCPGFTAPGLSSAGLPLLIWLFEHPTNSG